MVPLSAATDYLQFFLPLEVGPRRSPLSALACHPVSLCCHCLDGHTVETSRMPDAAFLPYPGNSQHTSWSSGSYALSILSSVMFPESWVHRGCVAHVSVAAEHVGVLLLVETTSLTQQGAH